MELKIPGDFVTGVGDGEKPFVGEGESCTVAHVLGFMEGDRFVVKNRTVLPAVNDIVIGRVIRAKRKEAHLVLLCCNETPLKCGLLAELRSVDISSKDVDSQVASKFCKPGDIIKARVVALGRTGFYAQLSTAEEGLGVMDVSQ